MKSRKDKGRIEGPFVPMLVHTMASPAWKAMSPYARVVYAALRSRYGHKIRNNGRIYLSTRDGAEETGLNDKTIARSLRELAVTGKGAPAHGAYRRTALHQPTAISKVNHSLPPQWSAPTLTDLPWSDIWAGVYRDAFGATKLTLVPDVGDGLDIPSFLDRRNGTAA